MIIIVNTIATRRIDHKHDVACLRMDENARIFRFGEGLNLRNSLGHIYDFPHFPLMGDRLAVVGMAVRASLHPLMISICHEGRQPGPDGMGTLRKSSRTSPGSSRPDSSAVHPRKPSIPHDSRRRAMPYRGGCSSACSADKPCTRNRRSLAGRRPPNVVVVALANKMARTIRVLLAHDREYQRNFIGHQG